MEILLILSGIIIGLIGLYFALALMAISYLDKKISDYYD